MIKWHIYGFFDDWIITLLNILNQQLVTHSSYSFSLWPCTVYNLYSCECTVDLCLHMLFTFKIFVVNNSNMTIYFYCLFATWYCSSKDSIGSWMLLLFLIRLLMWTRSSITFFLTPSFWLFSLSSTGGRNLETASCPTTSLSYL